MKKYEDILTKYKDRIFVGNIIRRTMVEDEKGQTYEKTFMYKGNAILFKLKNGLYLDFDELNLKDIFVAHKIKQLDKIDLNSYTKTDKTIDLLHGVNNINDKNLKGIFIDNNSLIPYKEFINKQPLHGSIRQI